MKKSLCLLILFLCLKGPSSWGQTPFFQQYHPLKKNQPVQVNTMLQDRTGFVWLGTNKGLFRFDGTSFRQYTTHDSLPDIEVTALSEDSLGRIWTGHRNGRIAFIERGVVRRFDPREGSPAEPISDILFGKDGTMWFSTKNDGLYYFASDRLYRIDEAEGLPDLFIYDLYEDASGNIWAGTDAGIAVCSIHNKKIQVRVMDTDDGLPDIIIKKIKPMPGGKLGFATEDAGVLSYDLKTGKITNLIAASPAHGPVTDFVVKGDQIWISNLKQGLVVYDSRIGNVKTFSDFNGMNLLSINSLMKDREGNIWVGSKTGLARTAGDDVEHMEFLLPGGDNNVMALTVDAHERIWFSTNEGLFIKSNPGQGAAVVVRKLQKTTFRNARVISLYTDAEGYVWAGLYGDGLLRIHPDNGQIRHFKKELRNGNILSITGRENMVWVATLGGASSISIQGDEYMINNYSSEDGLSSDFIYHVFVDSQNRTWFATDGKGVTMLDTTGFHHYWDGLASKVTYSITEDIEKNIWVTSQDNGLYKFDGRKFVTVPEVRLRDNSVHALVADDHGNLIALHNFGIDVYDVNRKQMRYWGEETGIRDKQPNLNAIAEDGHGQFFIGTTRGVMKFSLGNDPGAAIPQPVVDAISVFGEEVNFAAKHQFKYNENNVTVHYLGFWFQNAENLNYLYKLENYDLEWIATRDRDVTYSRLPAGEYTFKLKASDTDDFTHATETTFSFSIRPPFWRTSTFYIFIIAFFFIGAYGLMRFREKKLLEDKLMLEAKVEERTREIQHQAEEIQAQNEEIMAQAEEIQGINENLEMLVRQRTAELEKKNQALEEYAFINAHKLRSPVASILGLVNLLAKCGQQDDTSVIRGHLKHSADKLDAVVRSITKVIEKADNKFS